MDEQACVNDVESKRDMEEGELEDGELDENVDTQISHAFHVTDKNLVNNESELPNPKHHHDKKKRSKKRKREDTEKQAYHTFGDHQHKATENYEAVSWHQNTNRFAKRSGKNKPPWGPYDSPYSSAEDLTNDEVVEGYYPRQQHHRKTDSESFDQSPKNRRCGERRGSYHKEKRMKRHVEVNAGYYGEQCYDEVFDERGKEIHKAGPHKSHRLGSNKKKKFDCFNSEKAPPCKYFLDGKCFKGDECSFNHCLRPPKKQEMCKFYLAGGCKKNNCTYSHEDWPGMELNAINAKEDYEEEEEGYKPIHDNPVENTEDMLYFPESADDGYGRKSSLTEDIEQSHNMDKRKIPSLLDMEIFPPGHVPRRPSPTFRGGFKGFQRSAQGQKFPRGQRRESMTKIPGNVSNFGVDDLKNYSKEFMKPEHLKHNQGWDRKPYGMDWCKRGRQDEEWIDPECSNVVEDCITENNYNFDAQLSESWENGPTIPISSDKKESDMPCNDQDENYEESRIEDEDDKSVNVNEGNECEEDAAANSLRNQPMCKVTRGSNDIAGPPDLKHQPRMHHPRLFQNLNNVQVPNMLNITPSLLRIPPPNVLPNVLGHNPVSCPQPGILGAPPMGGPILQLPVQNVMPSRPMNLQQPGIQPPQIPNPFVPPQQPLAGILGQGPRPMFGSGMPPASNQPFMQLPPYPPPRFDLSQIITNIVRNTLNSQPPTFLMNPQGVPSQMANNLCIPPNTSTETSAEEVHSINAEESNNNSVSSNPIKAGTDPRLKNKDEKGEILPEEQDLKELCKVNEISEMKVPEIDGTAKKITYNLKSITLSNIKPSVPVEVLMNFKGDLSLCDDPRLKKYSRSLSDFNFDIGNMPLEPQNYQKKDDSGAEFHTSTPFSPPSLLSPSESSFADKKNKPYSLPDIFIPPTSAPNIEMEEKLLSGSSRTKLRKTSGQSPLFSPSNDVTIALPSFSCQQEIQLPGILMKQHSSPNASVSAEITFTDKVKKKIDYRNDPRFKKKKTGKNEEGPKEDGKDGKNEPELPLATALNISSVFSEQGAFTSSVVKSLISRIPSPTPTFPLYCTNFGSSGMFMSDPAKELEDTDNEPNDANISNKEHNLALECEQETEDIPSSHPSPFYPERSDQSPDASQEISLKDIFKTIDPTTSPFC